MKLRAFGGPLNGELVELPQDSPVVLVPLTAPITYEMEMTETGAAFRTGRYDVEKLGFHDADACRHIAPMHTDSCTWSGRCLVYSGYPKDRIVDEMNAVIALAMIARGKGRVVRP